MPKYDALRANLDSRAGDSWHATFTEIESVLGFHLPASARTYPAWWANQEYSPQSRAWIDAGWTTGDVDIGGERLVFRRVSRPVHPGDPRRIPPFPAHRRPDLPLAPSAPGARIEISHTPLHEPVGCNLGGEWTRLGEIRLDNDGRPIFPQCPDVPAIYRFSIRRARNAVYVGETERLARRFYHYRNPGIRQLTNSRIRTVLVEALRAGSYVEVSVITGAWVDRGIGKEPLDLSKKEARRLIENAALIVRGGADIDSLNLP